MVRWLRLHDPDVGVWTQSLVGELRSCILCGATKKINAKEWGEGRKSMRSEARERGGVGEELELPRDPRGCLGQPRTVGTEGVWAQVDPLSGQKQMP